MSHIIFNYSGFRRDCDSTGSRSEWGTRAQGHCRCGRWCIATNSTDGRETDYSGHRGDEQRVGRHAIVASARCAPRGGTKVAARFRYMLIPPARNGKIAKSLSDRQSISLKQRFSIAANQAEPLFTVTYSWHVHVRKENVK